MSIELIAEVSRVCDACGIGGGPRSRCRDGLRRCDVCRLARMAEQNRAYKDRHRDRVRKSNRERLRKGTAWWPKAESRRLQYNYGITLDDYHAKEREQGCRCAMCGLAEVVRGRHGATKKLAVDHDHADGRVRDLLCDRCNRTVGVVETSRAGMEQLTAYLLKWGIWRA